MGMKSMVKSAAQNTDWQTVVVAVCACLGLCAFVYAQHIAFPHKGAATSRELGALSEKVDDVMHMVEKNHDDLSELKIDVARIKKDGAMIDVDSGQAADL